MEFSELLIKEHEPIREQLACWKGCVANAVFRGLGGHLRLVITQYLCGSEHFAKCGRTR